MKDNIRLEVDYYGNASLMASNSSVTRVVIVVHGNSRNADDYADYIADAAVAYGVIGSTLVVAPHFPTESDSVESDDLYWSDGDAWKDGSTSKSGVRPWTMSSYEVMDRMRAQVAASFPAAKVVVTGHSAGGQFVQRYAAGTVSPYTAKFIPANPGSYMYLDARRWKSGVLRNLTSSEINNCSHYNEYKYGLVSRNNYMSQSTDTQIRNRYKAAKITYLLGGSDTGTEDLDTGCEANWQGSRRLQRGEQYFSYVNTFYGTQPHVKTIVPGVGHEGRKMYNSTAGKSALFS